MDQTSPPMMTFLSSANKAAGLAKAVPTDYHRQFPPPCKCTGEPSLQGSPLLAEEKPAWVLVSPATQSSMPNGKPHGGPSHLLTKHSSINSSRRATLSLPKQSIKAPKASWTFKWTLKSATPDEMPYLMKAYRWDGNKITTSSVFSDTVSFFHLEL